MRVAFLVTTLLGTGHLARTSLIADAFVAAGHDALVVSGGFPSPLAEPKQARLLQIPQVRSNLSFTAMFDADGEVVSEALLAERQKLVRDAIVNFAPDVLVTEQFPFGRRKLGVEFLGAIEAAKGALILCSIRDILQLPEKPGRKEEGEERFDRHYDGALFHGKSDLIDLSESWPIPPALRPRIIDTGYIGDATPGSSDTDDGHGEIVVAAGGNALGTDLFPAAAAAGALMPDRRWRLLIGGPERLNQIAALGTLPPNVIAEPTRPDFRALLARCRVAVLQCGYNTALDVVATGSRVVFSPFEGVLETEQLQRARAMADRYGCGLVREGDLSGEALAGAVRACAQGPAPDYGDIRLDGAENCVGIVEAALAAKRR